MAVLLVGGLTAAEHLNTMTQNPTKIQHETPALTKKGPDLHLHLLMRHPRTSVLQLEKHLHSLKSHLHLLTRSTLTRITTKVY